jgi:hypothetical protein
MADALPHTPVNCTVCPGRNRSAALRTTAELMTFSSMSNRPQIAQISQRRATYVFLH